MKLVDAMALGFSLVKFDPDTWVTRDGTCGCALGGALVATGRHVDFCSQMYGGVNFEWIAETAVVRELWPWLTAHYIQQISEMAWAIKRNEATREQLLAYVRSIEPQESTSIFDLPDISLEEQHRLEDLDAERESIDA